MDVAIDLDLDELVGFQRGMMRRARNLRPVFRKLEPVLKADIDESFRLRTGPVSSWPDLAQSTRERLQRASNAKKRGRGKKSTKVGKGSRLGRMRKAFDVDIGRQHLIATSKIDWAHVHQFGGRAGRGGRSDIPQRMHMYLSQEFIDRAKDAIAWHVAKGRR